MAANRFKNQSKYKNAFAQVPKREFWLQDVLGPNEFNSLGRAIAASTRHTCFCWETPGTLALYPLGHEGRLQPPYSLLHAHSSPVTDLEFSPFFEDVLATAGEDKQIKLWRIQDGTTALAPATILDGFPSRIEGLSFNPYADNILASCSGSLLSVCDLCTSQNVFSEAISGELLQSLSWSVEGRTLGVVAKDRVLRYVDPRAKEGAVLDVGSFPAGKEFQVKCMPDEKLATSSLTQSKDREIAIWDARACKKLNQLTFGNSNRTMSMLFDPDTNMLLLGQRGEVFIHYIEFTDSHPFITQGASYLGKLETKSLCLIPKRAVDVMRCEINRILQLTKREIVPISFGVTRKSYLDFHSDLYPETSGIEPGMSSQEWVEGTNRPPKLTTLNPQIILREKSKIEAEVRKVEQKDEQPESEPVVEEPVPVKPVKVIPGLRSTPFKHLQGNLAHKNTFIFDLPPLCKTIPLDGKMLHVSISPDCLTAESPKDVISGIAAVTLQGAGGQIALIPIQHSGRLLKCFTLENTSNVIDLAWDKFNPSRLVVASEDSKIRVWNVTPDNLESGQHTHSLLEKHRDRPSTLAFHPHASSLFVSSGFDCQLLIWDLDVSEVKISLNASSSPIVSLAWSPDGSQLATFNRDCQLQLYSPLEGVDPVWVGTGPSSGKAARVVWLSDRRILLSGFEKVGTKVFYLIDTSKNAPESILTIISVTNVSSPSLLIPHFDRDTSLIFFTTRGESLVFVYEYLPGENPYFFSLSPLILPSQNQELFFFPKIVCRVRESQIVRGVRLTQSSLEEFGFKVPRVRIEFFQDDIFPLTEVTWEPMLTAAEWLSGKKPGIPTVSLKPADMTPLSKAPVVSTGPKTGKSSYAEFKSSSDHEKELVDGMIQKMQVLEDKPLKQDLMEGVDDDEWGD